MVAFLRYEKLSFEESSLRKKRSSVVVSTFRLASMLLPALIPPTTSGPPFPLWEDSPFSMHSITLVSTSFQMSFVPFPMQERQLSAEPLLEYSLTFATSVLPLALFPRPARSTLPSMATRRDPLVPLNAR